MFLFRENCAETRVFSSSETVTIIDSFKFANESFVLSLSRFVLQFYEGAVVSEPCASIPFGSLSLIPVSVSVSGREEDKEDGEDVHRFVFC